MTQFFMLWMMMSLYSCDQGICQHSIGLSYASRNDCEYARNTLAFTDSRENVFCVPIL